jgi:hypothetical protein
MALKFIIQQMEATQQAQKQQRNIQILLKLKIEVVNRTFTVNIKKMKILQHQSVVVQEIKNLHF